MECWPFTPTLKATGPSKKWASCVRFTDHYDMLISTFCMQQYELTIFLWLYNQRMSY